MNSLRTSGSQTISRPTHALDDHGVGAELVPQAAHVCFDEVGSCVRTSPDPREKIRAGNPLSPGFGETGEKSIFARCQLERAAANVGHVLAEVDDYRSASCSRAGDPPQHRTKTAGELPRLKRASHEVVGTLVEYGYVMIGAVALTKHDDRPSVARLPKRGTRIDPF